MRARVLDAVGNTGVSSPVIMQGPQPDRVTLVAPAFVTAADGAATVQVAAGQGNSLPTNVTLAIAPNNDGVFQTFSNTTLSNTGAATISLRGLSTGMYVVEASITDPAGNNVVSLPQAVTVTAPSTVQVPNTSSASGLSTGNTPSSSEPLSIIPNVGQVAIAPGVSNAPDIQFVVPINQSTVLLSSNELDLMTPSTSTTGQQQETTQSMLLVGANATATGVGQNQQSSYSNIYVPGTSRSDVPNYGQVTFANVYPGINLSYQGNTGKLEYSFSVSPGANPGAITLSFPGDSLSIDASGDLVMTLPDGSTVTESAPLAYQTGANGSQQAVTCSFAINNGQVSFSLGAYSTAEQLVIDPYIWGNFFNGNGGLTSYAVAITGDSCGNTYLLSTSDQIMFGGSSTAAAFGNGDAIVTKLNSSGIPIYTTYLGGTQSDLANGIAVDGQGNVYITGITNSPVPFDFENSSTNPSAPAAFNTTVLAPFVPPTCFVASLTPSGTGNQWTVLGGTLGQGVAIAVDGFGNIWVAGDAPALVAGDFPGGTMGGPFNVGTNVPNLPEDCFLTKFAPDNLTVSGYEYTDLFGNANTVVLAMTIDSDNQIYVTGVTMSNQNMPYTGAVPYTIATARSQPYIQQGTSAAGEINTGFLLQFQENAATLGGAVIPYAVITYGTLIGGNQNPAGIPGNDETFDTGVYVRDQNAVPFEPNSGYIADVYLTGTTNATNFFVQSSPGLDQTFPGVGGSGWVNYALELQIGPATLLPFTVQKAGTFIGTALAAPEDMTGGSIVVDTLGNIYVDGTLPAGEAISPFFDTNPIQPYYAGTNINMYLTVLNPTASVVLLGTSLGGIAAGEEDVAASPINFAPPLVPFPPADSLFVDATGNIYVAGSTNNTQAFQGVIQNASSASQVFINPASEGAFVAKITGVAVPTYGADQFEPDDTSDLAANLDAYQGTNAAGAITYGPFPNLNTYKHASGPVGDGLNYNSLYDYDWYQILPTQSGPLQVTLNDINVLTAGPAGATCMTGTLDLYVYQVINGFLYLLSSSTLVNSSFQATTFVNVTRGADILIDVNPYNYSQASYTMTVTM